MKIKKFLLLFYAIASFFPGKSQQILDPCFQSPTIGMFYPTPLMGQICGCQYDFEASDMLEWDGEKWLGTISYSQVDLAPPTGCVKRAVWMGHQYWTPGGEGIALKLDKPFEAGKTYQYSFTYARDGVGPNLPFTPLAYTSPNPSMTGAQSIGNFTPTFEWRTDTLTFTATATQTTHTWLIVKTFDSSGIILAPCRVESAKINLDLPQDGTLCMGDTLLLHAPVNDYYHYQWNTGAQTPSIVVTQSGTYEVEISLSECSGSASDAVEIEFIDCTVVLEMPSFFSPNEDSFNPVFKPITSNYINRGWLQVFNRWGEKVFEGDLFEGWNGKANNRDAATGVYFWTIGYTDKNGTNHNQRGVLQLSR
ncbi:MAG TPA: gliding motility-associated C-terminal domain-containing protein [Cyclobacteriaceae bacterium]|nr:gliding motility-associated C-terminal domain-containing protein [Cyclobacteriaceae bacterium]HNU43125.1 gliding motility-associated C-terminal domain-containing protein [Cyclobacteriaceae bacterium]